MWLSILIPSKRPKELAAYIDSLNHNARIRDYEIVVAIDEGSTKPEYPVKLIEVAPGATVSKLYEECYKESKGRWVLLSADDFICETQDWDIDFSQACVKNSQKPVLIWPNDCIFGPRLSCMSLVRRKWLDAIHYFPMPYERYKMDDTLFDVFPKEFHLYLPHVVMRHLNVHGTSGYPVPGGGIYPNDEPQLTNDTVLYAQLAPRRIEQRKKLMELMNE